MRDGGRFRPKERRARLRARAGRLTPGRALRLLSGVGVASMLGTFIVVPLAFTLLPVPAGADAVTLCFPGFGPLQQFSEDLDEDLQEIVFTHEQVHAQQCRRLGAAAWVTRYRTTRGRLELEAEAFCAEIELLADRGMDPEILLAPRVETLHLGYRNRGRYSEEQIRELMRATCRPQLLDPPRTYHPMDSDQVVGD